MADVPLAAYILVPGLALGLATGLSKTKGSTKTGMTLLAGLIGGGGAIALGQVDATSLRLISVLSAGFIIGILVGAIIRVRTSIELNFKWA